MNNFFYPLQRRQIFDDLSAFGLSNLNSSKVDEIIKKVGDTHVISHRSLGSPVDFPLDVDWIQVFCIKAHTIGMIHKDGLDRQCALNIPLVACEQGEMQWFTQNLEELKIDNSYTKVRILREEIHGERLPLEPTFSTLVNGPAIVSTNNWHRVYNSNNPSDRYMLSIRFKNNPTFEEVVESWKRLD